MKCPTCGAEYSEPNNFCIRCGATLVPRKRGTHWIPILILTLLSLVGFGIFLALPSDIVPDQPVIQDDPTSDTPWFTVRNGTLYFNDSLYDGSGELTVPAQINGQTIREIGNGCFEDCDRLITVILPDTIEYIGPDAFADCDYLRGIALPEGLTDIEDDAFADCTRLEAITIPASVEWIGWDVFDDCDSLRFIFYEGESEVWFELYPEKINPDTCVYCTDGSYWQEDYAY
ncbi:MAG: leucine-rich repeat protein [Oscillospiraceae bacterium]|nr:leucine-rich repeat protein [Oscillospiraceae bacterium]